MYSLLHMYEQQAVLALLSDLHFATYICYRQRLLVGNQSTYEQSNPWILARLGKQKKANEQSCTRSELEKNKFLLSARRWPHIERQLEKKGHDAASNAPETKGDCIFVGKSGDKLVRSAECNSWNQPQNCCERQQHPAQILEVLRQVLFISLESLGREADICELHTYLTKVAKLALSAWWSQG